MLIRPHLTRLLDEATRRPLTIVTGGPGTGKTTAVAEWTRDGVFPGPVAWVSLDRFLSTPHRVWAAIAAALESALGVEALGSLRPPRDVDEEFIEALSTRLWGHEVVLVLDDTHELPTEVLGGLDQLLRNPPAGLHTVLISRHVPVLSLHRHRLAGRLTEVRSVELAFTREEIRLLATDAGVALDEGDVDHLHRATDGWVAAVRLAMLLLVAAEDPKRTLAAFSGEQPLIAGYLAEELTRSVSAEVIDVLTLTSVTDRICAPLARALVGAEALPHSLRATWGNVPLMVALSDTGWFRYHPLLLQLLRSRLREEHPEQIAGLHARASAWFESQGEWLTALDHAIESEDTALAIRVGLRSATAEFHAGGREPLAAAIDRIQASGPADQAELLVLRAMGAKCRREYQTATDLLARAALLLGDLPEPRRSIAMLNVRIIEAALARVSGDGDRLLGAGLAGASLLAGLEAEDAPGWSNFRGVPSALVGVGYLWSGRPAAAAASLSEARLANAGGAFKEYAELTYAAHTALALVVGGDTARARPMAEGVISAASGRGSAVAPETAQAWLALALILQQEDQRAELERVLTSAEEAAAHAIDPFVDVLPTSSGRATCGCSARSPAGHASVAQARGVLAEYPGLRYAARLYRPWPCGVN